MQSKHSFESILKISFNFTFMEIISCPSCDGRGYEAGHNPHDPHENGCSSCPIQVPCDECRGEGRVWIDV